MALDLTAQEGQALEISYADLMGEGNFADAEGDAISFVINTIDTTKGTLQILKAGAQSATAVTAGTTVVAEGDTLLWTAKNIVTDATSGSEISAFTIKAKDDSASTTALSTQIVTVKVSVEDDNTLLLAQSLRTCFSCK